jgi:hypothetical protein
VTSDQVGPEHSIGDINRIEWVKREGADWLAIGGTEGVAILNPSSYEDKPKVNAREVLTSTRVLKTAQPVVSFCLNATNQAIGLLSTSGYFCLFSVANLNRVWHRQLPSSAPNVAPSSVRFCEANLLVGRGNDTILDLIQITVELAVLSTIKFVAPSPSPPALHFAHAEYDSDKSTLIVAPFARGSVYAFHYALKASSRFAMWPQPRLLRTTRWQSTLSSRSSRSSSTPAMVQTSALCTRRRPASTRRSSRHRCFLAEQHR